MTEAFSLTCWDGGKGPGTFIGTLQVSKNKWSKSQKLQLGLLILCRDRFIIYYIYIHAPVFYVLGWSRNIYIHFYPLNHPHMLRSSLERARPPRRAGTEVTEVAAVKWQCTWATWATLWYHSYVSHNQRV